MRTLLTGLLIVAAAGVACEADEVRIYLPRSVWVEDEKVTLGDMSVISCDSVGEEKVVASVPMGRAPYAGEHIEFNRAAILSRLAAEGVDRDGVRLTGAASVSIRRREQVVKTSRFVDAADAYLAELKPGPAGCNWQLLRRPKDATLPDDGDFTLKAQLAKHSPRGYVKVQVSAVAGEKTLTTEELLYKIVYPHRRLVTTRDLPIGEAVTDANTRVETVMQDRPDDGKPLPYGQVTRVVLTKGSLVDAAAVRPEKKAAAVDAVAVRRNESVVMKIEGNGFRMTCLGVALQDGKVGEPIKVRNADSKRIVTARVAEDGSVCPLFDEVSQ